MFHDEARALLARYFRLEDPTTITPIGLELKLEVEVGGVHLRGIIDRLELDADGELVVTDYKTGKAPGERQEQQRLAGVAFYSLLCERLFGKRPARVQLLYLADPVAIISVPTDRSTRGVERKLAAIWTAIERACEREDFRPNPGRLCDWCGFKAYCPSFGGDIALADAYRIDWELAHAAAGANRPRSRWRWLRSDRSRVRCRRARAPRSRAKQLIVDFDEAVDQRVDRLRGHRTLDRVMYGATELGDCRCSGTCRRRPGAAARAATR